jgi:hypothetical protein
MDRDGSGDDRRQPRTGYIRSHPTANLDHLWGDYESRLQNRTDQCYLEGVMYGEAVTWTEEDADVFKLI